MRISWRDTSLIAAKYCSHSGRSSGSAGGHTFGAKCGPASAQVKYGSSGTSNGPMSIFSLRSPGALASSEYERPSLPTADQPRTWSGAGWPAVSLTSSGWSKKRREMSYTSWMNSSGTPCPVIWKNPISSQAWATWAATPSGSVPSRNGAMSMTGTVSMRTPRFGSPGGHVGPPGDRGSQVGDLRLELFEDVRVVLDDLVDVVGRGDHLVDGDLEVGRPALQGLEHALPGDQPGLRRRVVAAGTEVRGLHPGDHLLVGIGGD